jgi:Dolichyl-phosphate-mannose-protein mannosyltransferase
MQPASRQWPTWLWLILTSGIPRILAAFLLPNTFGDAYVYIRDIGVMSTKIKTGTFALTDFYGFWLPLYQFLAALLNVFVGNGFYSGKLVSALFGVGTCLFVYAITEQLTQHRTAALLGFLLIALNPIHILTSSSALTDVPHAFFVLASLYFVLKGGWFAAAIFAALAGMTRVESWMFIALIPLIQFLRERRVSIPGVLIMLIPPLLWFYVSWKATGDWLACFRSRQEYHDWLLVQNPALASFSFAGVLKDSAIFINSIDVAVLIAAFVAGWFCLKRLISREGHKEVQAILPPVVFFFAFFALLVVAYITHQQPIMFPRYGLILFSIGIPMLAWTYLRFRQAGARKLLISIIVVCVLGASVQFVGAIGVLNQISAQRGAAEYLRNHFDLRSNARIFCDEGTVTVMSGIPMERFLTSTDAPKDREGFLKFLSEKKVKYLVYIPKSVSTPARVFPDLEHDAQGFQAVSHNRERLLGTNIWIYKVSSKAQP